LEEKKATAYFYALLLNHLQFLYPFTLPRKEMGKKPDRYLKSI
jgi:hypothetical protein